MMMRGDIYFSGEFIDMNQITMDQLANYLEQKHVISSSWQSYAIMRMVEYYRETSKKPKSNKMIVCFELTMPNIGSWNGKWSGENKKHYKFYTLSKKDGEKLFDGQETNNWYYRWEDGWGANINAKIITSYEKRRLKKISDGFCGYDWMIESILKCGEIRPNSDWGTNPY